jgi:hypothetical protein
MLDGCQTIALKPYQLSVSTIVKPSITRRASGVLPMCREAQFEFRSIELSGIAVFIPQQSLHQTFRSAHAEETHESETASGI